MCDSKRYNGRNEELPLLLPQRSYGSLIPYYEFVKTTTTKIKVSYYEYIFLFNKLPFRTVNYLVI